MAPYQTSVSAEGRRAFAMAAAARLGVVDAMVFRRIGAHTWAHLGGLGRGQGWAGLIDLDETRDSLVARIPARPGEIQLEHGEEPERVLGPYYARTAAIARLSDDIAVVLGNPTGPFHTTAEGELIQLAHVLMAEIDGVEPAKRLSDEIEILSAVRAVLATPVDEGAAAATKHLLALSMAELACEIGVFRSADGTLVALGEDEVSEERWHRILDEFTTVSAGQQHCADDRATIPSATLLDAIPRALATLAVPVPEPLGGILLFIHTTDNPRGYSNQCRRLVENIIDSAGVIIRSVLMYEELRTAAAKAAADARTDPLTGLGNRLAWDEALVAAQERVDAGETFTVITIDVDGLKSVNDRYGQAAGDDLLRRTAEIIRSYCDERDLSVRMGGDEFAVLVSHGLDEATTNYYRFASALSAPESSETAVAASVGIRSVPPGGNVFDAVREADLDMYANKRARRRSLRGDI